MIDLSKKYVTRDGREVELFTIKEKQFYPVKGMFRSEGGEWIAESWTMNGTYSGSRSLDLIEVKPDRVVWINEYEYRTYVYSNKERADSDAGLTRIALHRVVLNENTRVKEGQDE